MLILAQTDTWEEIVVAAHYWYQRFLIYLISFETSLKCNTDICSSLSQIDHRWKAMRMCYTWDKLWKNYTIQYSINLGSEQGCLEPIEAHWKWNLLIWWKKLGCLNKLRLLSPFKLLLMSARWRRPPLLWITSRRLQAATFKLAQLLSSSKQVDGTFILKTPRGVEVAYLLMLNIVL